MQFQFRYGLIPVQARIQEGVLTLRALMRHQQVVIERLRYLYVDQKRGQDIVELLLCEADGDRLKRTRAYANPEDPQFMALVEALLELRPDADVRARPRDEVYTLMGSRSLGRGARWGLLGAALLGLGIMLWPLVWHGLDRGQATLSVAALAEDRPLTRNLTLTGGALLQDQALVEAERAPDEARVFFPLKATVEGPVVAMVEVRGERRLAQIREGAPLRGVLRDVVWEGPSPQLRAHLEARGLEASAPLYLFEFGARAGTDLTLVLGIIGVLVLMGWIVRWALAPHA